MQTIAFFPFFPVPHFTGMGYPRIHFSLYYSKASGRIHLKSYVFMNFCIEKNGFWRVEIFWLTFIEDASGKTNYVTGSVDKRNHHAVFEEVIFETVEKAGVV